LKAYAEEMFTQTGYKNLPDEEKAMLAANEQAVFNLAYMNHGALMWAPSALSDEKANILQRFAKVFEQTYTRFLDLQKAEAQAREAQIQLSLERVRARGMAMHSSNELAGLLDTVFKELTKLDVRFDRCVIMIYDPKTYASTWWFASPEPGAVPVGLFVKYHENKPYLDFLNAWKERILKWEYLLEGVSKKEWDSFIFKETELSRLPEFVIAGMKSFERIFLNVSFNNFGSLTVSTSEPLDETNADLLLRFAKVFESTYTRFNDLKQAEAQAREAQVQLAMERVRARTMAMQKSEELREAVLVIYEQLQQLDFNSKACNIIILDKETNNAQYWVSGFSQELYPESYNVPYLDHPYQDALIKPWKRGDKYVVYEYTGKMKQSFDEIFFTQTEFRKVPEDAKNVMIGLASVTLSTAFISYGALQALGAEPLSEEKANILKRFAKVFEQTYTRFLDLQKAEAQARESQIEAALEKIRSRSLAMHQSKELKEVIAITFEKLNELNVLPGTVAIQLFDKKSMHSVLWVGNTIQDPQMVDLPYDKQMMLEDTLLKDGWQAMIDGVDIINKEYSVEQKNKYFNYLFSNNSLTQIPEQAREVLRQMQRHIVCLFVEKNSAFLVDSWAGQFFPKEKPART
jgi:hypothetical protein